MTGTLTSKDTAKSAISRSRPLCFTHIRALLLYTLLALILTWPLARHFATHVTGDGIDDPALAWNLWWLKARLIDQLQADIFHVDWMFHPLKINLAFYTLTPLNGLLSIPLQTAANLIVANNLLLIMTYVLGGYGAYLLAYDLLAAGSRAAALERSERDLAARDVAALLAGIIYAFASSKLFYASLGQFNIASSQWIPFCILYVMRAGRLTSVRRGRQSAAMAGLFLVFQSWTELTYASFLLIFIGFYLLWRVFLARPAGVVFLHDVADVIQRFLLTGVIFILGIGPILWAMLADLRREGDFFASGGGFADTFSADLMGYLTPTRLHPLLGNWAATLPFANDKGQHIYIGYSVLALALLGLLIMLTNPARAVRRLGIFWGGATLLFWLLTLGPEWRWAGESLGIPGPFALVSRLPFFSGNRYPSRYSVMLMLSVAMLAAVAVNWLMLRLHSRKRRRSAAIPAALGLAALILLEHLSAPLPLTDFRVPPIFSSLTSTTEPPSRAGALLELPTGWRNGARVLGKSDLVIMMQQWYQTEHGLRRLGGNTSRNPAYKFQYFTEAPLIGDLIALMNADDANPATQHIAAEVNSHFDEIVARNREQAPAILDFLGVEQVLVYADHATPALLRFIEEALPLTLQEEWQGADWQGRPSTLRLYAVVQPADTAAWTIDLADDRGKLHLAEGWSATVPDGPDEAAAIRYALRSSVDLMLDIPTTGGLLSLDLVGPAEQVAIALNGRNVGEFALPERGPERVAIMLPPGAGAELIDRLTLTFSGPGLPSSLVVQPEEPQGWPVGASGVYLAADSALTVRSAGADVGNFAQIFVSGHEVLAEAYPGEQRGYYLVAVEPGGAVAGTGRFDTFGDAAAASAMAAWIDQWPTGTIIAGAVADEAGTQLDQAAVDALRKLGVKEDLRGRFRQSHAFIGVVDAALGSVPEATALLQPATAGVGSAFPGPEVFGGVSTLTFTTR